MVVEEKIMPFVFASLEKLVKIEDNIRGQKNTFIRLKLPWTNCEFVSLSAYLQDYKSFVDQGVQIQELIWNTVQGSSETASLKE